MWPLACKCSPVAASLPADASLQVAVVADGRVNGDLGAIQWPGNGSTPTGESDRPCQFVKCGPGTCMTEPSVGRRAGWCACPEGWFGPACTLREPAPVKGSYSLTVDELEGLNEDGSQATTI